MGTERLELSRARHRLLRPACLPIPPHPRNREPQPVPLERNCQLKRTGISQLLDELLQRQPRSSKIGCYGKFQGEELTHE